MIMRRCHTRFAVAAVLAALALPAAAEERPKAVAATPREGIEALEAHLTRAVDRVSLPEAGRLLGRVEPARGYRLPGYGVVFVLTPRTLPAVRGQVYVLHGGSPVHRRVRIAPHRPSAGEAGSGADDEEIETFERQVLVLQQETEAARRAAEEEMDRIVQNVRVRAAPPSDVHVEVHTAPEAPEPPGAPAAPGAPPPPAPAEAPLPPAPPPWKFWFGTGTPDEKRSPEAVVADVRGAVIDALATQEVRLAGLAADERVTVTVDFVPGGMFAASARPEKTLVVSARVKDVDARARGAITPEELRKRVEVTEY
jgi:hypothetical protein